MKKRGKKGKGKKKVPQKGDPDYLTPTQLRNRRKRRAKKLQKEQEEGGQGRGTKSSPGSSKDGTVRDDPGELSDPSMRYIADPTKAPVVQAARRYFRPILRDAAAPEFEVHLGPLRGWRTVAKLAVRPDRRDEAGKKAKVAVGLFSPGTHALLPVPDCPAHHPSINRAVECVTRACHEVGVAPYRESGTSNAFVGEEDEDGADDDDNASGALHGNDSESEVERGTGQLRYLSINVARETGAVQITLVWNGRPPDDDRHPADADGKKRGRGSKRTCDGAVDDPVLQRLVAKLIAMSGDGTDDNSRSIENRKDASSSGEATPGSKPGDGPPAKKRRRRGRREGKSDADAVSTTGSLPEKSDGNDNPGNNRSGKNPSVDKGGNKPRLELHSLWINYNPSWKHSNAIFSYDPSCWKHVHGPRAITEHLTFAKTTDGRSNGSEGGGSLADPKPAAFPIPLAFPPNVFRQANLDAFADVVGRIRERMQRFRDDADDDDVSCVELYGGVGTIGLHLADVVSSLASSDENPNNAKCFDESVRSLPAEIRPKLSYVRKSAAEMVDSERGLFEKSRAIVVDPPRKGLDAEVVDYLCGDDCETTDLVVYVSCGFRAFQRDCDALTTSGRWKVEFAEGYLLFPGSDAIETLAFFVRA
ncbi:hypothetical protein ACHAWF_007916 [Thalassiosira exigua]